MMNKRMKQVVRKAMALAMTVSLGAGSLLSGAFTGSVLASEEAQEAATAISVRVLETDGVVEVTNQCGVTMPVFVNMKLQTGYEVITEEASYAWMVLDDVKTAELDAVSDMKVQRKGEELALMLDAGNMFFDVEEKLDEEESMSIRTSTMVMGIRGTAGIVRSVNAMESQVCLLDGEVEIRVTNPLTDDIDTATIHAGQKAICRIYELGHEGKMAEIIIEDYQESEVDGFVLKYLADHPKTQDRIRESGGGDYSDEIEKADERLKEEQEKIHEKLEEIEEEYEKTIPDKKIDKVFEETESTPSTPQTPKKPAKKPSKEPDISETETETEAPETETEAPQTETNTPETGESETETPETGESETETPETGETDPDEDHDHIFGDYVPNNDATCTTDGTMTATCLEEGCGETDTMTDEDNMATGHSFTWVENNDAACLENGTMTGTCTVCGYTITEENPDSMLGHDWGKASYNDDAACEKDGTMTVVCNRCGASETTVAKGTALEHIFKDYDINPDDPATMIAYCENGCGATDILPVG